MTPGVPEPDKNPPPDGWGTGDPDPEARDRSSAYWVRTLGGTPEAREGAPVLPPPHRQKRDPRARWKQWYATHPFWRAQRMLAVLGLLLLGAGLLVSGGPLHVLRQLAGPEDPPLRVVQPGRLAQRQADGSWAVVAHNAQLQPGQVLRSNSARVAVLRVRGGGSVRLDRETWVQVQRLVRRADDSYQVRTLLTRGQAFVRELSTDTLPVETPFTRLQPQQACYAISHLPAPEGGFRTQVRVYSGKVVVGLARGPLQDVTVEAGQRLQVAPDRLGRVQPLDAPDPWQAWNLSWVATDSIPPWSAPPESPPPPGTASPAVPAPHQGSTPGL